jgi:hypothetical protein
MLCCLPYTLAGFEPGSSNVPEVDAMSTVPRSQRYFYFSFPKQIFVGQIFFTRLFVIFLQVN